ncbi:MAG: hypothetical protein ACRDRS_03265 [Pseudonocardiaceae bacterium]
MDEFVADRSWPVQTVANTIFPKGLYHPRLGDQAAARLYENYELSMILHRRRKRDKDTYFNRMLAYPTRQEPFNQLEYVINRLRRQLCLNNPLSSAYEIGLSHHADAEIRIQQPKTDRNIMSFPCLSHISLTLAEGQLHLHATYRNQSFITRALGNYLGLTRLLGFLANEVGTDVGEVHCTATHADLELGAFGGKLAVRKLLAGCRDAIGEESHHAVH